MLSQNFMGLYDPRLGAGQPGMGQPAQAPTGAVSPTQGASWVLPQQVRQPTVATQQQDPWALLQPKLDAYLSDWWAKRYASTFGGDTSRQEQGAGAEMAGSGQEFNGAGAGANRDASFESGSAGRG